MSHITKMRKNSFIANIGISSQEITKYQLRIIREHGKNKSKYTYKYSSTYIQHILWIKGSQ